MRNAAASFDDDYASDEPVRPSKARKARAGARKKPSARGRKGQRKTLHYAAIALSASLAVGIMVNALVLQHSRHPAPLFSRAVALSDAPAGAAAPASSVAAMEVARAPVPLVTVAPPAAPSPAVQHPRRSTNEAAPAPAVKASHEDAIAKLLKASAGGDKDIGKSVLATQHALVKLGFVVKPTGVFGPATRAAIEAFEREQHLPVKGEMSRKVLKQISAESGIAID